MLKHWLAYRLSPSNSCTKCMVLRIALKFRWWWGSKMSVISQFRTHLVITYTGWKNICNCNWCYSCFTGLVAWLFQQEAGWHLFTELKMVPFSGNNMCWSHTCPTIFVLETEKSGISLSLFVQQNLNWIFPKQTINI